MHNAHLDIPGVDAHVHLYTQSLTEYHVTVSQNIYPNELSGRWKGKVRSRVYIFSNYRQAEAKFHELAVAMVLTFKDWKR